MHGSILSVVLIAFSTREIAASVDLIVSSTVFVQLPAQRAELPCEFEMQNKSALFNILWESSKRQTERVIQRDSSGTIFKSPFFNQTAYLGYGCSLILTNPRLEHSGRYCVKVFILGQGSGKAVVQLNIEPPLKPTVFKVHSKITTELPQTTMAAGPTTSSEKKETETNVSVWLGVSIPVIVVLFCIGLFCWWWCAKRPNAHSQKGNVHWDNDELPPKLLSHTEAAPFDEKMCCNGTGKMPADLMLSNGTGKMPTDLMLSNGISFP